VVADAVGTGAAQRIKHHYRTCFGVEAAIDAVLPSEPEHTLV